MTDPNLLLVTCPGPSRGWPDIIQLSSVSELLERWVNRFDILK